MPSAVRSTGREEGTLRRKLSGAPWRFGAVPPRPLTAPVDDRHAVEVWRPATVPGHVQADLMASGLLPDVERGDGVAQHAQANERDWWYEAEVSLTLSPGQRAFLHFEGIDYLADIWWNTSHLARHEGQFVEEWLEVTHLVPRDGRERQHRLGVRLWGPHAWPRPRWGLLDRLWQRWAGRLQPGLPPYHRRLGLLREQMSFGWDFVPACIAPGIWDDVWLVVTGDVAIRHAWVDGDPERPTLRLELDATRPQLVTVEAEWRLTGAQEAEAHEVSLEVRPGVQVAEVLLPISSPHLWWPWEHGAPHLYELRARVLEAGVVSDTCAITFGLRRVRMDGPRLLVNGTPLFMRGVNWVPADLFPGRLTRDDYGPLLRLARKMGVNTVRVWGGGLREKRPFYELCDELGLLVWQDFPFACAFADRYPRDQEFLAKVDRTAASIVKALRGHPSVAVWCAGNEFSPRRNRPLVERLARAVAQHDGTRPFRPPSPGPGETHNWYVWHGFAPVHAYLKERAPLVTEFGLQALPARETLAAVEEEAQLWPPGPAWERRCGQLAKLERYARAVAPNALDTLEGFIAATQAAQAWGLQVMVEHQRRRKAAGATGVFVWQWNEPWPAISWALVDHFGRPKEALNVLGSLYAPVFVTLAYRPRPYRAGDRLDAEIWAVNDTRFPVRGAEVRLFQADRPVLRLPLTLPPTSARLVHTCRLVLRLPLTARLELWHEGERRVCLAYNFARFDARPPARENEVRQRVARLLERF